MRSPEPWYRAERDAWLAQVVGKQVLLAKDKARRALMRILVDLEPGKRPATLAGTDLL
jgi:hypothetical protein